MNFAGKMDVFQSLIFGFCTSWKDDEDSKFNALEHVAESFFKEKRRYPTFWLDKVFWYICTNL